MPAAKGTTTPTNPTLRYSEATDDHCIPLVFVGDATGAAVAEETGFRWLRWDALKRQARAAAGDRGRQPPLGAELNALLLLAPAFDPFPEETSAAAEAKGGGHREKNGATAAGAGPVEEAGGGGGGGGGAPSPEPAAERRHNTRGGRR